MVLHRRTFVSTGAAAGLAAGLSRPLRALGAWAVKNEIGLQLWTVRNEIARDRDATLQAIADAGYGQVELMNVLDSADIVAAARQRGLNVRSAFFNWQTIAQPDVAGVPTIEAIIEAARSMGLEYLVFGYIGKGVRETADQLKAIADRANRAAEKIQSGGMRMSYHNHAFEFAPLEGGKCGYEIFMERFDPQLIHFELDVFWAAIGGWDPVETLKKLGPRTGQVHLKDLKGGTPIIYDESKVPADAFQEVGDGIIDMDAVMRVATSQGVRQFHVEQDQSPDPLASIRQSRRYAGQWW